MALEALPLRIGKIAWIISTHPSSLSYEVTFAISKTRSYFPVQLLGTIIIYRYGKVLCRMGRAKFRLERKWEKRLFSAFLTVVLRSQCAPQVVLGDPVVSFRQKN